jgi:SAM-dependent methyltransferase/uncharacterized protein YbaR (Trm112 family)
MIVPSLLEKLACPRDLCSLKLDGGELLCEKGHTYSIVDGIPIMLWEGLESPHPAINASLAQVREATQVLEEYQGDDEQVDEHVQAVVGATCGILYKHLVHRLPRYPIPEIPYLPKGAQRTLLDIGCNWGRWCISASRKHYNVIGLDPDLGAILAAKRIADKLSAPIQFVVGDARSLPFKSQQMDTIFSYSVLQHLSKSDCTQALRSVKRVAKSGAQVLIQMPNRYGVRSLYHLAKRNFREGDGFEVRYYSPTELMKLFEEEIGDTKILVDGFFGLGIQKTDLDLMPLANKLVIYASEFLKKIWELVPALHWVADSLYVNSHTSRENT